MRNFCQLKGVLQSPSYLTLSPPSFISCFFLLATNCTCFLMSARATYLTVPKYIAQPAPALVETTAFWHCLLISLTLVSLCVHVCVCGFSSFVFVCPLAWA